MTYSNVGLVVRLEPGVRRSGANAKRAHEYVECAQNVLIVPQCYV